MNPASYAIILVLLVIFITVLLSALIKKSTGTIITKTDSGPEFIEMQLRKLLSANPDSEIYVCNVTKNAESYEITERLSHDFPQIHIKD